MRNTGGAPNSSSSSSGASLRRRASSAKLGTPIRSSSRMSRRPSSSMSLSSGSSSGEASAVYSGTIRVSVRPRPLDTGKNMWVINSDANCVFNREAGDFFYDNVFSPEVDNKSVYSSTVEPVVNKCLEGYNGTVFAYGMTGSGKTYSMQGGEGQIGLIDLCVEQIFSHFDAKTQRGAETKVVCSYLEIYNEKLFDLLNPETSLKVGNGTNGRQSSLRMHSASSTGVTGSSAEDLRIRDDPLYGVKVVGLTEVDAPDAETLLRVIRKGDSFRRIGGTDFNARSSRSHAIVLIRLTSRNAPDAPQTVSTLCLCDLAGSEKAAWQLERLKEGSYINKSLLALGTVISKLSQGSSSHIPYRDSKLTRLLQPSLSGNSIISILCTIHLSTQTFGETVNTLRFASRAKNISYSVSKMENSSFSTDEKFVESIIRENEKLKKTVSQLRQNGSASTTATSGSTISDGTVNANEQMAELVAENKILSEQLEHQKRLNEEVVMEQVMNNNESLQQLVQIQMQYQIPDPKFDQAILGLEQFGKTMMTKMEEMKSYIMHLEQKLSNKEYEKALLDGGREGDSEKTDSQEDQIEELQRALKSKESIIKALKSAKSMREIFEPPAIANDENRPQAKDYLKPIDNKV
ncbi:DEKNAAC100121 [Brettanomyces naardenensis]|uniref:Kinesin-like protein n=1 Tax=Brettanomyces naardenensis TaxID=13370 RepID=A0A448YF49_BRENA|nr:DEKNAAC100121 [Brettanomyces naardenensis]